MKKIIIFILITALLLSVLVGCNDVVDNPIIDQTNLLTESDTPNDTASSELVETVGWCIGDPITYYSNGFNSQKEYEDLIKQYPPNDSFLRFEDIAYIGELSSGSFFNEKVPITDYRFYNSCSATYVLENEICTIITQRLYGEFDSDEWYNYYFLLDEIIEIEGDSLINHNLPKGEDGFYPNCRFIMEFKEGEDEYYVQYIYSQDAPTLIGFQVARKVSDYWLEIFFRFTDDKNFSRGTFDYDMSNEEINKFLSKETAKEAIVKLYTSHLEAVESRSGN